MFGSVLQKYQAVTFGATWLAYAVTYFLRKPLGVIKPLLELELKFTKSQLGWLDVALLGPYSLAQVSSSKVADRFGPRLTICLCLALSGTAMFTFGFWNSYFVLFILMAINGAMQGPCWPACCKIVCSWYPDAKINTVIGILATSAFMGGAAGTAFAVYVQSYYGWRMVHVPASVAAVGFALLIFCVLKTPESCNILVPGKESSNIKGNVTTDEQLERQSFWSLWRIPAVFEITMTVLFTKIVRYCMIMWLPMYLLHHLHYTVAQAGMFSTIFDIGGSLGSPLIGFLLDRYFGTDGLFGMWTFVTTSSISLFLFAATAQFGFIYNAICIFVAGATNCAADALLAGSFSMKIGEADGRRSGAAVTGLVNGIGTFGAVAEGPIVGFIADTYGWSMVFTFMIILSAMASLMVFKAMIIQRRLDRLSLSETTSNEKVVRLT